MSPLQIARKTLLWPLSSLYSAVMATRNKLYDRGILPSYGFDVPIVSVGNLTMGGTGKTPILAELIRWSEERGLRPAIVSRGYRGQVQSWAKVNPKGDTRVFGDEPVMLAQKFDRVPIYVGADRVAVIKHLLEAEDVQIIFTDDTFQHRRLKRSIDILILDCTEDTKNYAVLPSGRGRENQNGLRRADFIILNKVNLVSPADKQKMLGFIDELRGSKEIPIIECEYYIREITRLDGGGVAAPSTYEKVALVSGVGRPQTFETLMGRHFDVRRHFIFRDHHDYTAADLRRVLEQSAITGVQRIVTTEKDAVKFRRFLTDKAATLPHLGETIWVAALAPKLSLRVKSLHEQILARVR